MGSENPSAVLMRRRARYQMRAPALAIGRGGSSRTTGTEYACGATAEVREVRCAMTLRSQVPPPPGIREFPQLDARPSHLR